MPRNSECGAGSDPGKVQWAEAAVGRWRGAGRRPLGPSSPALGSAGLASHLRAASHSPPSKLSHECDLAEHQSPEGSRKRGRAGAAGAPSGGGEGTEAGA